MARARGLKLLPVSGRSSGTDDERQVDRGMHRFDKRDVLEPHDEERIHPGRRIRFRPSDRTLNTFGARSCRPRGDDERGIAARGERGLELSDHLRNRHRRERGRTERRGLRQVFETEDGHARMLGLFDGAHHVERIAVAVIGVDEQREIAGAHDAADLVRELGQSNDRDVGGR